MKYTDTFSPSASRTGHVNGLSLNGSPLVSVGMQARNFTAPISGPEPGIAPEFYSPESLAGDIERLCDPDLPLDDTRFLNVAVKYFFAYVHDGAHRERVEYGEIASLYERFSRHQSLNEPGDDIELMNLMRQWSPVLRVLADAPRAAHIMRLVAGQADAPRAMGGPYVGVDIGAGTGIMLLAQQIQARRNGFADIRTLGFQSDPLSGERTHDLVHSLGMGGVMLADPARACAYGMLRGRPVSHVANEMAAGIQQSLDHGNFFGKYEAFFAAVGGEADRAVFFPEGVIAHSGVDGMSVILTRENGFSVPPGCVGAGLVPQGLIIGGEVMPVHKLGRDFYAYLT